MKLNKLALDKISEYLPEHNVDLKKLSETFISRALKKPFFYVASIKTN